ncbi:MAG TPA: RNA polymerase sigma factor [Gemmatales bacterium]|nr:RNA polymerase sigma factor [Gemmatales bacterium]HMP58183.1 RNA polymerase sigma factor [Gemmatales bacterium]
MAKTLKLMDPVASASDEELLGRFQKGETDVFGPLVKRYERELYGYLRRYLGDDALAEDVFQNTFLRLYENIDKYEAGRAVRPWIYSIATHQAIDALRRAGRRAAVSLDQTNHQESSDESGALAGLLADKGPDPFAQLDLRERQQLVRSSIDRLPEHLKLVVLLSYYQGLKYKDIADVLEVPVGTVKSRLHFALKRLHEDWQQSGKLKAAADR